jgi:DNA-binding response OmpR family regulator
MAGHRSAVIRDGGEVMGFLEKTRPDLIVLDVMLPGRDGFALMETVLRRYNRDAAVFVSGGLTVRLAERVATLNGREVELTACRATSCSNSPGATIAWAKRARLTCTSKGCARN